MNIEYLHQGQLDYHQIVVCMSTWSKDTFENEIPMAAGPFTAATIQTKYYHTCI